LLSQSLGPPQKSHHQLTVFYNTGCKQLFEQQKGVRFFPSCLFFRKASRRASKEVLFNTVAEQTVYLEGGDPAATSIVKNGQFVCCTIQFSIIIHAFKGMK
jgi:hypothetical protein